MTKERENELREQAAIILAAANGAEIEYRLDDGVEVGGWVHHEDDFEFLFDEYSYRLKPTPAPPKVGELLYDLKYFSYGPSHRVKDFSLSQQVWSDGSESKMGYPMYYTTPFFGENQPKDLKIKVIELTPEVEKAIKDAGIEI